MVVDRKVQVETDEARGGSTPHVVRWILGISLLAAIVLLSAVWIFSAATQSDEEAEMTATGMAQEAEEGEQTDGVLIEGADELPDTTDAEDQSLAMPARSDTGNGASTEQGQ